MASIRRYVSLALLVAVALFALQNVQDAAVTVMVWTFHLPLIVVILLSLVVGIIIGWLYPIRPPTNR